MRRKVIFAIICLSLGKVTAQLSSTSINFNNYISASNNDLTNNFSSTTYYNLAQNGSNYYISTPLQDIPGQGLSLCTTYQGVTNETFTVSIDYKLDLFPSASSLSNGIGIFLRNPNTNELVLSTRIEPQSLYIDGLINPSSTTGALLVGNAYQNGSWYRLIFEITKTATDKFSLKSSIYSLDSSGNYPTNLVASKSTEGMNYQFSPTQTVKLEITGSQQGDVKYLDNLNIFGYKNGNKCSTLSTAETKAIKKIGVFPNPVSTYINFSAHPKKVEIYSISGQLVESYTYPKEKINIEHLQKGTYILKLYNEESNISEKFIKN